MADDVTVHEQGADSQERVVALPKTRLPYDAYLAERKMLIDAEGDSAKAFDQAMLTLSAGALGASLTIIRELAPKPPEAPYLLYATWIGFAAALASTVFSFLFSQYAMSRQRDILDQKLEEGDADTTVDEHNAWDRRVHVCNWSSIVLFLVGVAALTAFAIANYPK